MAAGRLKRRRDLYLSHRNDIQRAGVQYIIDSVVAALLEDKERRFQLETKPKCFWKLETKVLQHFWIGSSMLSLHSSGDGGMNRLRPRRKSLRTLSMTAGNFVIGYGSKRLPRTGF